jgi:hypothetical protein
LEDGHSMKLGLGRAFGKARGIVTGYIQPPP